MPSLWKWSWSLYRKLLRVGARAALIQPPPIVTGGGTTGNGNTGKRGVIVFAGLTAAASTRITIPILRKEGTFGPGTVTLRAVNGTAVRNVDFFGISETTTLTWVAGETQKTVDLTFVQSISNKSFILRLENPDKVKLDPAYDELAVTISGTVGPAGQVGFVSPTAVAGKVSTTVDVIAARFTANTGAVTVDWETEDGTAVAGVDYTYASGTLSWANGESLSQSNRTITVTILAPGGGKYFKVRLYNPTGGLYLDTNADRQTVNIYGTAGAAGDLGFYTTTVQKEESTVLTVTVRRVNGTTGAVGVTYATANGTAVSGTNYTAVGPLTLSWANGDGADKTFNVTLLTVSEDLNFYVNLSLPTGGAALLTGYTQQIAVILNTAGSSDPIVTSEIADDSYMLGEDVPEESNTYDSQDVHVIIGSLLSGNVIGPGPGTSGFGQGGDLASADEDLLPSMPGRFQMFDM